MTKRQREPSAERSARLEAEVRKRYPDLHASRREGVLMFRGAFPLEHKGRVLDRFLIEVEVPEDFPKVLPTMREVGGRIPRTEDRHVNGDGTTCPLLDLEAWEALPGQTSLVDYLDGPVRNFFLWQLLVEAGQEGPWEGWAHGDEGRRQYLMEKFGTSDLQAVRQYLDYVARDEVKGHWVCPCGSGRRMRNCHFEQVKQLRAAIPQEVAAMAQEKLWPGDVRTRNRRRR